MQSIYTTRRATAMVLALALCAARADEVKFKFVPSGASAKLGYIPQHLALSAVKPDGLTQVPADLSAPLFGELKLGPANAATTFHIILDEPSGKPSRLFVDANGNGDFSGAAPTEWIAKTNRSPGGRQLVSYSGGATLKLAYGAESYSLHVPMYRFDKNDPQRANVTNFLFYYGDYAWAGTVNLGGKVYSAMLADRLTTGDFTPVTDGKHSSATLMIDVNGDGRFDVATESFRTDKAFRVAGARYEVSGMTASGSSFQLAKSAPSPEEASAVPGLARGNRAFAFAATTTDGNAVKFPESYQGKLVLLDFWATWCPPCREEIPHIAAAYQQFHAGGFEILGVSLDQANAGGELSSFTQEHNMPWPQVYDGKYWQATVAQLYQIQSIPHAYLVDGDTGLILAEGNSLRGDQLTTVINQALAKRNPK